MTWADSPGHDHDGTASDDRSRVSARRVRDVCTRAEMVADASAAESVIDRWFDLHTTGLSPA